MAKETRGLPWPDDDDDFGEKFGNADDVDEIVERLVNANPQFPQDANYRCIFSKAVQSKDGQEVVATVKIVSERDRVVGEHDIDFLIVVSWVPWTEEPYKRQQERTIFHELCHCFVGTETGPCLVPHDVQEFAEVVKRYGLRYEDELFAEAAQPHLPGLDAAGERLPAGAREAVQGFVDEIGEMEGITNVTFSGGSGDRETVIPGGAAAP